MFWNNTFSESGMNIMVAGLGSKDAKDYCEIEMLNERLENARVAAGAAVNALKGSFSILFLNLQILKMRNFD